MQIFVPIFSNSFMVTHCGGGDKYGAAAGHDVFRSVSQHIHDSIVDCVALVHVCVPFGVDREARDQRVGTDLLQKVHCLLVLIKNKPYNCVKQLLV